MRSTETRTARAKTGARGCWSGRTAPALHEEILGLRMDALRCGAGILKIDILRRDPLRSAWWFRCRQCPINCMRVRAGSSRGTDHIGSEGVPEAMWVGQLDAGGSAAMIAEQGT